MRENRGAAREGLVEPWGLLQVCPWVGREVVGTSWFAKGHRRVLKPKLDFRSSIVSLWSWVTGREPPVEGLSANAVMNLEAEQLRPLAVLPGVAGLQGVCSRLLHGGAKETVKEWS